jgi:hypothetical protein
LGKKKRTRSRRKERRGGKREMTSSLDVLEIVKVCVIFFTISVMLSVFGLANISKEQNLECFKLGYEEYSKVGEYVGICESEDGSYVNVNMKCSHYNNLKAFFDTPNCVAKEIEKKEFSWDNQLSNQEVISLG